MHGQRGFVCRFWQILSGFVLHSCIDTTCKSPFFLPENFVEYVTLRKKSGSIGFTQCFQAFDGESDQNTDGLKRGWSRFRTPLYYLFLFGRSENMYKKRALSCPISYYFLQNLIEYNSIFLVGLENQVRLRYYLSICKDWMKRELS